MGRAPCCDKANVKKGPWSPEEDAKLKSYIDEHGTGGNWIALPQKIGLKRCGKSCRLRWLNYLRPNIKHGGFSDEEDNIICSLYISIGSRWSIIAAQLPGRTDNDIKNYWNTRLKKKLLGKQRKEKSTTRAKLQTPKPNQDSGGGGLIYQSAAAALPQPLPQLQPIPYSDEEPRLNNHASIRQLLMKLGGRFSSQDQNLESDSATDDQALLQPIYGSSPNIDHQLGGSSDQVSLEGVTHDFDYSAELERVVYENQQRLQGLDELLYDDAMMNRVSWGEMHPWSFAPNSASSSSDVQGFVQEEYSLEKMRYQGTL